MGYLALRSSRTHLSAFKWPNLLGRCRVDSSFARASVRLARLALRWLGVLGAVRCVRLAKLKGLSGLSA
eukprot:15323529-Alexandrium_andersonii.AAC.1